MASFSYNTGEPDLASLLESIRNSQAWKDTVQLPASEVDTTSRSTIPAIVTESEHDELPPVQKTGPTPGLQALLARLNASSLPNTSPNGGETLNGYSRASPIPTGFESLPSTGPSAPPGRPPFYRTPTSTSFSEAFSTIASKASDPAFAQAIGALKEQQNTLEQQLWKERMEIRQKFMAKIELAKKRAEIINVSITQHEAETLQSNYRMELQKFDKERVLTTWKARISLQKDVLESLGVPLSEHGGDDPEFLIKILNLLQGF
ncbi:hypothetical protein DL96DRAFT_1707366 [Flagelloscypha sp. PMI_526]|nr:hypothetical protein DL96DRAFT_1707366 [Flagelloscypha sp. PMI_526]